MRGILLAGGKGSRLWPATAVVSKQLLPCAGRPLVMFPLCTLMEAGIREVCVITMPAEQERFRWLLGDGKQWGLDICYAKQPEPNGLPEAFRIAEAFVEDKPTALILGDNLFIDIEPENIKHGTNQAFAAKVRHPERYGVLRLDKFARPKEIVEKPKRWVGEFAIAGLYIFANGSVVTEIAKGLKPSKRGETEISDVLNEYIRRGQLRITIVPPSAVWLDCGTPEDLHEASALVMAMEKRTGEVIGSPELVSLRNGWITQEQFDALVAGMPACAYRDSLCQSQNRNHRSSPKR